jgi:hypothetical protein
MYVKKPYSKLKQNFASLDITIWHFKISEEIIYWYFKIYEAVIPLSISIFISENNGLNTSSKYLFIRNFLP